jgi:hypothetical protein
MSNIPGQSLYSRLRPRNESSATFNHDIAGNGGSDDSNDEYYDDMNDAAASEIRRPPLSRKRIKRAKDVELNDLEIPFTHSLNVSC